ncbi:AAA family ATPase [Candidatus Woesearchaeota archaeon]|nr:AAA family ATPase [Candidatus Woesearchaeota archaeon]
MSSCSRMVEDKAKPRSDDVAIWTEKYRPKQFSEVKGQKEIVERIKAFVEKRNMPHVLFAGPAGVGKTTLSLVIARQLFGDDWRENFLELNASDERGIDVVRVKVKDFARTRAIDGVPFKIIYMDECLDYETKIIVQSEKGLEEASIGEFVENFEFRNYKIMSVDDNGDIIFSRITKTVKLPFNANQGYYKIKVHDKEIITTGNHEFLAIDGWKRAEELQIKDLILCPQALPAVGFVSSQNAVVYNLIGLPQEIRKKEKYISTSPEKAIIELLAKHPEGLSRENITRKSGIASSKITSILSTKDNEYYLPLVKENIILKENNKFKLSDDLANSLDRLYHVKRGRNSSNQEYILAQLRSKELFPLRADKAAICARILGHLFSDGSLSLKTKQLFFSGKEEDMREIKKDLNQLGYYSLGDIKHTKWRNGEVWSFGAYKLELLSLFYSLGAPVGKKTDNIVKIPDWIMNGDENVQKEFLAAFFGGDGYKPMFQGRTIKPITIGISKREDLKSNLIAYLNQFKELLAKAGVCSKLKICPGTKAVRKDGTRTMEGRLWITNSTDNITTFLSKIGYRYCKYKEDLSHEALRYFSWKRSLGKYIYKFRPIHHFHPWREKLQLGDSAYHFVTSIEKIEGPDYVYCVSTESGRFIANNIVVHNCDALTKEAQQALRRTMENYTQTCRFILSCNYSSKIIDPIQSRCSIFRFKPLPKEEIFKIVDRIAKEESLSVDDKAKEALYSISEGDCRRLENIMQSCAAMDKNITEKVVYSIASAARPKEIKDVLSSCVKGDFIKARDKLLDTMLNHGLAGLDVIKQVQAEVWNVEGVDNRQKLEMIKECGEAEFRMIEGSDEFIQLEALLSKFILVGGKKL